MEEANIILDSEKLEIIQVMHRRTETEERIDYFIFADEWQGELRNNEPLNGNIRFRYHGKSNGGDL